MEIAPLPKPFSQNLVLEQKDELEDLSLTLHKERSKQGLMLSRFRGFWFDEYYLQFLKSSHKHFQAQSTDIILATIPKSGTTWLKALIFCIVNRNKYTIAENPLLFSNPHQLIPFLEDIYGVGGNHNPGNGNANPFPRVFSTHVPYQCLPSTIAYSNCRIIYLCRNLLDVCTSARQFVIENRIGIAENRPPPADEYLEIFCNGMHPYGPFCEHMLGYWNESLKIPQNVLFLKYEDLRNNTLAFVKKMAEFIGFPFSAEEEKGGLVEEIIRLCSLENLKNLEVNKKGEMQMRYKAKNSSFFRKGEVGDWVNHLSPSMAERLQKLMEEKFSGSGLSFEMYGKVCC